jgi:hypothetical protein
MDPPQKARSFRHIFSVICLRIYQLPQFLG